MPDYTENLKLISHNFPKATRTLILMGLTGVTALTIYKLNPQSKALEPMQAMSFSNADYQSSQISQLEQRIQELENTQAKPKTDLEMLAVNLCEFHGGNAGVKNSEACLKPEYFQRQAQALAPYYEEKIAECFDKGKGNACLKPQTYLIEQKSPKDEWQKWEGEQEQTRRGNFWLWSWR